MTEPVSVPPALVAQWEAASSRLFGSLVMDPDGYERAVALLGQVMGALRARTTTTAELLALADEVPALARAAGEQLGAGPGLPIDLAALAGAALAARRRELVDEQAARNRREALARAGGSGWVVLEEEGDPAGDPYHPYRRLEADASSGRALLVRADPDETYTACEHRVERLHVDPTSGALGPAEGPTQDSGPLADARAREELAGRWREPADPPR